VLQEGDPNSLRTLEWYVKELFSGNSNNEQIQKIHKSLESFSCQKGATEITRKISKHHLPDISATSREEREARPEKNPYQESTRHSKRREDHPG